jgi:hypothetical protein
MLGEEPQRFMFEFPGLLRDTPVLEQAAAGRGLLTINPERDGIVLEQEKRRSFLVLYNRWSRASPTCCTRSGIPSVGRDVRKRP